MRILVAVDKFKGSLSADEVGKAISSGLSKCQPDWEIVLCPIADGGEGTAEVLVNTLQGQWETLEILDARGRLITGHYGWIELGDTPTAVMEMSTASGLAGVSDLPLDPRSASTFGTGQMIEAAIRRGAHRILIGIGGSATNDGGIGMATALGYRFIDSDGQIVSPLPSEFERVTALLPPENHTSQSWPVIEVMCDVDNPLLGPLGATRIYGPQKGVRECDMEFFESRLAHLADLVARDIGHDPRDQPGAGAAGGLGFGLMAFLGATLVNGFERVASVMDLETQIAKADIVITGEGRLDAQTLHGKGPVGVARLARKHGKPVVGLAGSIVPNEELEAEFDLLLSSKPSQMSLDEAMRKGASLIEETVEREWSRIRETVTAVRHRMGG